MGVSGCGKSTLGAVLAQRLCVPFLEGDDFHPPANIAAMTAGQNLTDAMRAPWLRRLAAAMPADCVVSCSALRRGYRDILRGGGAVLFVHLALDLPGARRRMAARGGHFMNPALAETQAQILEPLGGDEAGVTLDARLAPSELASRVALLLAQRVSP